VSPDIRLHHRQHHLLMPTSSDSQARWRCLCALILLAFASFATTGAMAAEAVTPTESRPLLFHERHDLHDVRGTVQLVPGRLTDDISLAEPPGKRVIGAFELKGGEFALFGYTGQADETQVVTRSTTRDFKSFDTRDVLTLPAEGKWLLMKEMVRRPDTGEYLLLAWCRGDLGHTLKGFRSLDGMAWTAIRGGEPLFRDHDAALVTWSNEHSLFVQFQVTYQAWDKAFPDNMGAHMRRVLSVRTSPDGEMWSPETNFNPGSLNERAKRRRSFRDVAELLLPDEADPPDVEFYRAQAFRYGDRYVAAALLYASSPQIVNPNASVTPHGPMLGTEWWFSDDITNVHGWRRPFRGHDAGPRDFLVYHAPVVFNRQLLMYSAGQAMTIPQWRIAGAYARGNAEFSSKPFIAPARPVVLDASVRYAEEAKLGAQIQSYLMVSVLDENGQTVPGFEAEKCILRNTDGTQLRLAWGDVDTSTLAGRSVRLRFHFRDATVHACW
jgi:hypothetical protein